MKSTKVEFLGRAETAKVLGVSERTVLDYGQKGKLKTAAGVDPATRQPCVLFHAGDVERLKFEREQPRRHANRRPRRPCRPHGKTDWHSSHSSWKASTRPAPSVSRRRSI